VIRTQIHLMYGASPFSPFVDAVIELSYLMRTVAANRDKVVVHGDSVL